MNTDRGTLLRRHGKRAVAGLGVILGTLASQGLFAAPPPPGGPGGFGGPGGPGGPPHGGHGHWIEPAAAGIIRALIDPYPRYAPPPPRHYGPPPGYPAPHYGPPPGGPYGPHSYGPPPW